jgi:hypothetical protein
MNLYTNKMQSLILISFICIGVVLLYNFSISDIHQKQTEKQLNDYINHMRNSQLIIPTYNQSSYVSQKSMNNTNMGPNTGKEEDKKKSRMEYYNLCYDESLNDDLNINLIPKNLFTHP